MAKLGDSGAVQFRTANGGTFHLAMSPLPPELTAPWSNVMDFRPAVAQSTVGLADFRMSTGPIEVLEHTLKVISATERATWTQGGGHCLVVEAVSPTDGTSFVGAGWIGPWNVAYMLLYPPYDRLEDIQQRLSQISFIDTPEGLLVDSPKWDVGSSLRTYIRGEFAISIQPIIEAAGLVPRWSGLTVAAGEVWKVEPDEGDVDTYLMLASDSVLGCIVPFAKHKHDTLLRFVESIDTLQWTPPK